MQSKLKSFKKVAHLPIRKITRYMHMNEDELFDLMKIWIKQGIYNEDNLSHFRELQKRHQRRISQERTNLSEENFLHYQYLRQHHLTSSDIAEILEKDIDRVHKYDMRWYRKLKDSGRTDKEIEQETNFGQDLLETLAETYQLEQDHKNQILDEQLKQNQEYADYHLSRIEKELENPEDYLIIDLEGVQNPDEILEIAVMDFKGNVLMNTLVRPTHHIGWHVSQLTGINDKMASNGIGLYAAMRKLKKIAQGKTLLSWGIDYDKILLNSAMKRTHIWLNCEFACAQHIHMGVTGLAQQIALYKACGEEKQSHRALDDCKMVLQVLSNDIREKQNKYQA